MKGAAKGGLKKLTWATFEGPSPHLTGPLAWHHPSRNATGSHRNPPPVEVDQTTRPDAGNGPTRPDSHPSRERGLWMPSAFIRRPAAVDDHVATGLDEAVQLLAEGKERVRTGGVSPNRSRELSLAPAVGNRSCARGRLRLWSRQHNSEADYLAAGK